MAIAYLAIGSNIGSRDLSFKKALEHLKSVSDVLITKQSTFYTSEPMGGPLQDDYLNGVLEISTSLSPIDLLIELKNIERCMGRKASAVRNSPRIIDLDILLYDRLVMSSAGLTIPHPALSERWFVLRGLCEIAPQLVHPSLHKTMSELYSELKCGQK